MASLIGGDALNKFTQAFLKAATHILEERFAQKDRKWLVWLFAKSPYIDPNVSTLYRIQLINECSKDAPKVLATNFTVDPLNWNSLLEIYCVTAAEHSFTIVFIVHAYSDYSGTSKETFSKFLEDIQTMPKEEEESAGIV